MAVATLSELLHMNSENEESSYANNSSLQESVIKKAQMILKETIKGITDSVGFPRCFCIADLGCSSGPNTLLVISNIIDEVHGVCKEKNLEAPQFHICLNDLFLNDFNSIFKSLPMFYAKYNVDKEGSSGRCFISAVPGSFYGRLFSDKSMHFFHSSTSLQWLSQIPKGLENNNLNIYMSNTSPPIVCEIYKKQFEKDFTKFLESRSIEIVRGGRMFLTIPGRSAVDDPCYRVHVLDLIGNSLVDMVNEGLIKESEIQSFNLPIYFPHKDEVEDLINKQGSFCIDLFESFDVPFETNVAKIMRAGLEPILITHFGMTPTDILFHKFEKYADSYMSREKLNHFSLVISLTKF